MNRENGFGLRGDGLPDELRVQAPAIRQHIDKHRCSTQISNRCGRSDPVGVAQDHFVTRADAQRRHAHVQRASATGGRDGISRPEVLGKPVLKTRQVFVATRAPTVLNGIQGIPGFQFANARFGVMNSAH
ncbi:hypothetical protein D9M69_695080 [compost metagenome]